MVSVLAPAIAGGNTAVLVASERHPLPALGLAEVCAAAAELPPGVVNVLTGEVAEVAPWLAAHQDVNAIDLAGAPGALADDLAVAAAGTLKRVVRLAGADWIAEPGIERMFATLETLGQDRLAPAQPTDATASQPRETGRSAEINRAFTITKVPSPERRAGQATGKPRPLRPGVSFA